MGAAQPQAGAPEVVALLQVARTGAAQPMTPPYHVCFAVSDLAAAVAQLEGTLGLRFAPAVDRELGPWSFRMAFSEARPPFLELIEGPPGSPWACTDGPRFDHLGWWSADLAVDGEHLEAGGVVTDDLSFVPRGEPLEGRAAVEAFLAERQADTGRRTVHTLSNEVVRSRTASTLALTAVLHLRERRPDGSYEPVRMLATEQHFARGADGRWRIARRTVRPLRDPRSAPRSGPPPG